MKFCKKCEKQTPTSSKNGIEECMVCGTILSDSNLTKTHTMPKFETKSKPKSKDISDEYLKSKIETKAKKYEDSNHSYNGGGNAAGIMGGIMVLVIGFTTLTLVNYILSAISGSLNSVSNLQNDAQFSNTTSDITNYVITIIPLMGLALLVLGFAIVLTTLRSGMGRDEW